MGLAEVETHGHARAPGQEATSTVPETQSTEGKAAVPSDWYGTDGMMDSDLIEVTPHKHLQRPALGK